MSIDIPKKLLRSLRKLEAAGEEPLMISPALLERQATQRMLALARIGMGDQKIFSWLVVTKKSVHFIRAGLLWDRVQSISLEQISDVEYIKEFHANALKLRVGERSENIVFYDDKDGIKFYQYIKQKSWKEG